jgi:hypothetical protein
MDLRIGANRGGHEIRSRKVLPGITEDLFREPIDGRCPRDRGLLIEATGEVHIVMKCLNCSWRWYSSIGKLVVKISHEKALQEAALGVRRGELSLVSRREREDEIGERGA